VISARATRAIMVSIGIGVAACVAFSAWQVLEDRTGVSAALHSMAVRRGSPPSLALLAPPDTDVWVEVDTRAIAQHRVLAGLVPTAGGTDEVDCEWASACQGLVGCDHGDLSVEEDLLPWIGGSAAVAFTGLSRLDSRHDDAVHYLAIMRVMDEQKARDALPRLVRALWGPDYITEERLSSDPPIHLVRRAASSHEPIEAALCFIEGYMAIGNREEEIVKCLSRVAEGGDCLADTRSFTDVLEARRGNEFLWAFVSPRWLRELCLEAEEQERAHSGRGSEADIDGFQFINRELLTPLRHATVSAQATRDGICLSARLALVPSESDATGLAGLCKLQGPPRKHASRAVPSDTLACLWGPGLQELWRLINDSVARYPALRNGVEQWRDESGLCLDDLRASVGERLQITLEGFGGTHDDVPQLAFVLEGGSEAGPRDMLPTMKAHLVESSDHDVGRVGWVRRSCAPSGKSYEMLPSDTGHTDESPCIAADGTRLVISIGPRAMEACLAAKTTRGVSGAGGTVLRAALSGSQLARELLRQMGSDQPSDPVERCLLDALHIPQQVDATLAADEEQIDLTVNVPIDAETATDTIQKLRSELAALR